MGGGKSSSTNQTSTSNTNTSAAIDGDNLGVVLSVADLIGSNLSIQSVDHGAIEEAGALAIQALKATESTSKDALSEMGLATDSALDFGSNALSYSAGVSSDALSEMGMATDSALALGSEALNFGSGALSEMGYVTGDVLDFGADAMSQVFSANGAMMDSAMGAIDSSICSNELVTLAAMDGNADLAGVAIGAVDTANRDAMANLATGYEHLAGYMDQITRSDAAVDDIAQANTIKWVVGGALLAIGVMAVRRK